MKTIKEQIEEVTQAIRYPKVERLSDEQKEYVVWMLKKALKKQRKDVLGLIDEEKGCIYDGEGLQHKGLIDAEELKKRITG